MIKPALVTFVFLMTCMTCMSSAHADAKNPNPADAKSKDCVSCAPKEVTGVPNVEKIIKLNSIVTNSVYQDSNIDSTHQLYCQRFDRLVSNKYQFKKIILDDMKTSDYSLERLWLQIGCTPFFIGATDSPLIHYVAEDVAGKTQYLLFLRKYLIEQNDEQLYLKIINSKNSRGHTFLDYIIYLASKKKYIEEEIPHVNNLIKILCEQGASFSVFADKKCPVTVSRQ